jgi:hypothetical protein
MSTDDRDDVLPAQPGRPSIREKQRYYLEPGQPGYERGIAEAKLLLDVGASVEEAADFIGFSVPQLLRALPPHFSKRADESAA